MATEFSFKIFQALSAHCKEPENVFLSPFSISTALTMAANGADGQTLAEMTQTLCIQDLQQRNKEFQQAREDILSSKDVEIRLANSLWFAHSQIKKEYTQLVEKEFHGKLGPLTTPEPINAWCSEETKGKITKILDQISPADAAVILNAVYFKGLFDHKFDPKLTQEGADFFHTNGSVSKCSLMHQSDSFRYFESEGKFQAVQKFYGQSKSFSLIVILPSKQTPAHAFLANFSHKDWDDLHFQERKGELFLPRFKVQWKKNINDELIALGMKSPFTGGANFSKMSDGPLHISQVIHSSFVEVNEEGTEAAAVTAVMMTRCAVVHRPTLPPFQMRVDRPFLFFIRHNPSGNILFLGKIESPQ